MTSAPAPEHGHADECREERDMQAGDADEMSDAGAVEDPPLLFGYRALVAYGERGDDTCVRPSVERGEDAVADDFARALNVIAGTPREGVEPPAVIAGADETGGAELVLEEPGFDVEPVRIHRAVGALEPHAERPALAGVDIRHIRALVVVAPCGV